MELKSQADLLNNNFSKMNKKAKRSCPLEGGQLAFGME